MWWTKAFDEALEFARVIQNHPPTLNAIAIGALIALLLIFASSFANWLLSKFLDTDSRASHFNHIQAFGGSARFIRVSKNKLRALGLANGQKVTLSAVNDDWSRRIPVAIVTRRLSNQFTDDSVEISEGVLAQLQIAVSPNDDVSLNFSDSQQSTKLLVDSLPWYTPTGLLSFTFQSSDDNIRIGWWFFLVSLISSILLSEFYYQRSIAHEFSPPNLRPTQL